MGFNKQQLNQIKILSSKGFSMKQIADYLDLSYINFFILVKKHPEIISLYRKERSETTLKVAKIADEKVMGIFEKNK
jgi:DNA-binding transcriptional MerR regulator